MRPKKQFETPDLFRARLDQILDHGHPLFKLANQIDWSIFENEFGATYDQKMGRPAIPIRVMVALHYLKYTFNLSDEQTVETFVENGYHQYFCGFEFFQHKAPTDPSNMTRFRKRIGDKGIEKMLSSLIHAALQMGALKESDLQRINVDTTVMEKAVSFPTDARLYFKMRAKLVSLAKERDVDLRQSYVRVAQKTLIKHSRYAHAKQYKRAARERRKLKTYLGRVTRDLLRKVENPDQELLYYLRMSGQILTQTKTSKNKIYSIHAPEVECISKGKAHKRYEFGVKVGISSTSKGNWVVGAQSFRGNPYDGHTLSQSVKQTERLTGKVIKKAYVDLGYRGHNYKGDAQINIVDSRKMKKLTRSERRWFKRRSAIEPIIGHLKSDNRMSRNFLKGAEGDLNNALLCACGFNMRKLLAVFFLPVLQLLTYLENQKPERTIASQTNYCCA